MKRYFSRITQSNPESSAGRIHTSLLGIIVFGVVLLLVISLGLSWFHTHQIETQMASEIAEVLESEGFPVPDLEIEGRTVVFKGNVDARIDRKQMVRIVEKIAIVSDVIDERQVVNYARGRNFEMHSYAGITTVEGELPEQADIQLILEAIRNQYGADPLGADLEIHPAVRRPPWLDKFADILELLVAVTPLEITYNQKVLTIAGTLSLARQDTRLTTALGALLEGHDYVDIRFKMRSQNTEPSVQMQYKRGTVSIQGRVPSEAFSRRLEQSASLAFGVDRVDNNLQIDPKTVDSSILDSTLRAIFPLAITHWADLDISDGEVRVRGGVRTDEELEIVRKQMRENFGHGTRIIYLVRREKGSG